MHQFSVYGTNVKMILRICQKTGREGGETGNDEGGRNAYNRKVVFS